MAESISRRGLIGGMVGAVAGLLGLGIKRKETFTEPPQASLVAGVLKREEKRRLIRMLKVWVPHERKWEFWIVNYRLRDKGLTVFLVELPRDVVMKSIQTGKFGEEFVPGESRYIMSRGRISIAAFVAHVQEVLGVCNEIPVADIYCFDYERWIVNWNYHLGLVV